MRLLNWLRSLFSRKKREKGENVRTSPAPLPVVMGADDPIQALMVSLTFRVGGHVIAHRLNDGISVEIEAATDEEDNGLYFVPFDTTTPNEVMAMDQQSFRERFKQHELDK